MKCGEDMQGGRLYKSLCETEDFGQRTRSARYGSPKQSIDAQPWAMQPATEPFNTCLLFGPRAAPFAVVNCVCVCWLADFRASRT